MSASQEALTVLRRRYADSGIDGIYDVVRDVVTLVVFGGNYPPLVYSPSGVWDVDAYIMLANDFIIDILLPNKYIEHLLRTSRDTDGLFIAMEEVFRRFLINQKKRTVESNLYRRISKLVESDAEIERFGFSNKGHRRLWRLAGSQVTDCPANEESILAACSDIENISIKDYKPDSRKLPHLLDSGQLHKLVLDILALAGVVLTIPQILAVVKHKLGLLPSTTVSLDDLVPGTDNVTWQDIIEDNTSIENAMQHRWTAKDLLEQLCLREKAVVARYAEGYSMDEIAADLNCSKATVHNNLHSAFGKMRSAGVNSIDDAKKVMNEIAALVP